MEIFFAKRKCLGKCVLRARLCGRETACERLAVHRWGTMPLPEEVERHISPRLLRAAEFSVQLGTFQAVEIHREQIQNEYKLSWVSPAGRHQQC